MMKINAFLITIFMCGVSHFLNAQAPNIEGSWKLQKAKENQWVGETVKEKEYTAANVRTSQVVPIYNELTVSDGKMYGMRVGLRSAQKIGNETTDGSSVLVDSSSGKTVEYSNHLQDENTLVVTSKTSYVENGEQVTVEQTIVYKKNLK